MTLLRWVPSVTASAFHAVSALLEGRSLADPVLQEALAEPAANLKRLLRHAPWPADESSAALIDAATNEPGSVLAFGPAAIALKPLLRRRPLDAAAWPDRESSGIKAELSEIHAACVAALDAFDIAVPRAANELELRAGPLREQWEARGPGLLRSAGKLTEPELIVSNADVILLYPVLGGGGMMDAFGIIAIEAVLTNPVPDLPEVVRLGWLLLQLGAFQRTYPAIDSHESLAKVLPLALLAAVLAAAEDVELVRSADAALPLAIDAWRLGPTDPAVISDWWQRYRIERPAWETALEELDRRLG
jgi:hypothetical protein